jgi:PAS domain S-box-containing protein
MGMVDLQRMVSAAPRAVLDEAAYQQLKYEDFRRPTAAIAFAGALLVFSLWLWDWAIDARHAPDTFWLRVLLSVSFLPYPLALLAGVRRWLPLAFYASVLWLQAVFLLILQRLEGGAVHGIAGFMFWFIVPPLMSFILRLRANVLGNLSVMAFPSLLAGPLGLLPALDLLHLNAVLVPACGITIIGHVLVDRLLRRIYEYRWQLEWRSVALEALAEGAVIIQENVVRYANPAAAALVGRRPEQLVGTPLADYVRVDEQTDLSQPLRVEAGGRAAWVRVGRSAIVWQGRPATLVSVADVTDQLRADEALRKSEEHYRTVIENVSETIIIAQGNRLVFANPRAEALTGFTVEELTSRPFVALVHPEDVALVADRYSRRMRGEETERYTEFRVLRRDGGHVWVESSAVRILWNGEPATLAFLGDQTERRKADEALRSSEQRYREVVDNVSEGIIVVQDELFVFANAAATALAGFAWDEMQGRPFAGFVHPEDLPMVAERYRQRLAGEAFEPRYEFRILKKDGTPVWAQLSGVVIQWNNHPANLYFVSDIDERRRTEEALRHSEERYRLLVDHASEGILISQEGILRFVNPRIAELAGRGIEALTGRPLLNFIDPDDHSVLIERFKRRKRGEAVPQHEVFRLQRPDGELVWIEFSGVDVEWEGAPAVLSFLIDITERKRAEDELRHSEENYRHVIENSPVGITIVRDNRMMLANKTLCRMLESDEAALLEQGSFLDLVHADDVAMMREHAECIAREPEGGKAVIGFRIRTAGGRVVWVEGNTVQVEWQGKPATLSFIHDVTERRRLEESLKQTLAERETILERSIVGIALLDPKGRLRWANKAMGQIFCVDMAQIVGISLEPYYGSRQGYLDTGAAVSAAVLAGKPYEAELLMRRADGRLFWAQLSGKAVNAGDLSQGTVWAIVDIDQRKRLEEELKRTSAERELILQSMLVGIIYSRQRRYVWVNRAFADMIGYRQDELIGQSSRIIFPDEKSWREFGERGYAVMAKGEPFSAEWQMLRRDGTPFWAQTLGRNIDPENPAAGSIWTILDITARKQAEAEIRAALEKQKELSELKTRFVSMTSHEFRTPLAAILSSAELLKYYGERLPEGEKTELVDSIGQAVRRMTRMLEDILVIGRAEADRLGFSPAPLELRSFCAKVVDEASRAAQADGRRGDRIVLRMDGGEARALLDEKLMRHILGNLLSNALKYSPDDKPVVLAVETDAAGLRFIVADEGIGIPPEDLPRLFETFHRARNVGNVSGTGLGLAIVKKAVELHGGRIEVDSRPGAGSRFTVSLESQP